MGSIWGRIKIRSTTKYGLALNVKAGRSKTHDPSARPEPQSLIPHVAIVSTLSAIRENTGLTSLPPGIFQYNTALEIM